MNTGYIHSFNNLVKPIVELNVIRQDKYIYTLKATDILHLF